MHRYRLLLTLLLAGVFLGGCSDDEDKVLGGHDQAEEDLNTWIWVTDDDTGTIWIHDADTGSLEATLSGDAHPFMRQVFAGPDTEPTVWMGRGGAAYGFTRGFATHGDHVHMEAPEALGVLSTGPNNIHQGVDDHGDYVVYANDGDSTFTVIDVATRTTRTVGHGSGHSAAVYAHGTLIATDQHAPWARGIDADSGEIVFEVAIDTLAHGDAFDHDTETLFIATLGGIEVLDLDGPTLGTRIPYPGGGRVNFLYHAGEVPVAFGPHKLDEPAESIILLNMATQTAEAFEISGASLAWNIGGGNFALSENGRMLVATDLDRAMAYWICIDADDPEDYRQMQSLTVPAADMACAINYGGDHIWLLEKGTGAVYCYHPEDGEVHNTWSANSAADYIFTTSYPAGIEVLKDF